jgi:hypothetical protein
MRILGKSAALLSERNTVFARVSLETGKAFSVSGTRAYALALAAILLTAHFTVGLYCKADNVALSRHTLFPIYPFVEKPSPLVLLDCRKALL